MDSTLVWCTEHMLCEALIPNQIPLNGPKILQHYGSLQSESFTESTTKNCSRELHKDFPIRCINEFMSIWFFSWLSSMIRLKDKKNKTFLVSLQWFTPRLNILQYFHFLIILPQNHFLSQIIVKVVEIKAK